MFKGKLRNEIMEDCPEEFKEELKDWIDDLEAKLNSVLSELDIDSLSDLRNIEDAKEELEQIADGLY